MACIAAFVPKESISGSGIGTYDSCTLAALCGQFSTACSHPTLIYLWLELVFTFTYPLLSKINICVLPHNKIKTWK